MIYLDGSGVPFNATESLSRSVEAARENASGMSFSQLCEELKKAMAKFYGIPAEHISLGSGDALTETLLRGSGEVAVCRFDSAAEYPAARNALVVENLTDMRADVKKLVEEARQGRTVFLSNPCHPTGLLLSSNEIKSIADCGKIIVDESHMLPGESSVMSLAETAENLTVLKRLPFADGLAFAVGRESGEPDIPPEDVAEALALFTHPAAIRNAEKKLADSAESLYIRIKKLAVRYGSVERLYRSRAGYVFFKVQDAGPRAARLEEMGFRIAQREGFFCVHAGRPEENNSAIEALSKVLE